MKKIRNTSTTLDFFAHLALSATAQARLKGGNCCLGDPDDGFPPPPPTAQRNQSTGG